MSMIINTNVSALNAQRNLKMTNTKMAKTLEQLSSGLRIKSAADDAAGLAISEKMRSQVRGMQQGLRNAQDGVSMVQTAEGALNETHNILQRLRELAVQAGNTTLSSSDRTAIGDEMVALRSEVDNITTRTRFNGQTLLNGSLAVTDAGTGTLGADTVVANGATVSVASIDVGDAEGGTTYTLSNPSGANLTMTYTAGSLTQAETVAVADMGANGTQAITFSNLGVTINLSHDANAGNVTGAGIAAGLATDTIITTASSDASWRVGSEVGDDISLSFSDMRSSALGTGGSELDSLVADNSAVSTTTKADTLLQSIDAAIGQVSTFRAKLGARQNQLETAINSVGVSVENLSASESRIRDADIAQVSSQMVSQQIMQQAGVSVLAQANSAPQAVLKLISG